MIFGELIVRSNRFVLFVVLCGSIFCIQSASAAFVEISFAGDATNSNGDIEYVNGETFSGKFIFDTDLAVDSAPDPNVGTFGMVNGSNGLISAELITDRGTVSWSRANVQTALLQDITQQIQGPNGQVLNSVVMEFTTIPLSFGGSIDGLSPFSIFLQLASIGPNDTFFTDANSMITDTSLLSLNDYEGGLITLNFVGGDHTALAFGPNDPFSIVLQPVPIPAAIWLFASALGVLGYRARFNAGKAH
ncbi:MAG: hypothetical protein KDI54_14355 [Gammaproteobacteria bacterium]|nr:hypothetical protein [Gammaproteobacteria bacterium]